MGEDVVDAFGGGGRGLGGPVEDVVEEGFDAGVEEEGFGGEGMVAVLLKDVTGVGKGLGAVGGGPVEVVGEYGGGVEEEAAGFGGGEVEAGGVGGGLADVFGCVEDGLGPVDDGGGGGGGMVGEAGEGGFDFGKALAGGSDGGDDGASEAGGKVGGVEGDAAALGVVPHVEDEDEGEAVVDELEDEEEVALEVGGVGDAEDGMGRGEVAKAAVEGFDDDGFVGGASGEAVGSGEVEEFDGVAGEVEVSGFLFDGDAGEVSGALAKSGEAVEPGGFSGVGVAEEGDAEGGGGHWGFTVMAWASERRRLMGPVSVWRVMGSPKGATRATVTEEPGRRPRAMSCWAAGWAGSSSRTRKRWPGWASARFMLRGVVRWLAGGGGNGRRRL